MSVASNQRVNDFNMLNDFCLQSYESVALYKLKMKNFHDKRIEKRDLVVGELVRLVYSKSRLFLGNL